MRASLLLCTAAATTSTVAVVSHAFVVVRPWAPARTRLVESRSLDRRRSHWWHMIGGGGGSRDLGSGFSDGWDNENFLESLSQGPDKIREANEEYWAQSKYQRPPQEDDAPSNPGASASASVPTSPVQAGTSQQLNDEAGPGGTRFQQMLEQAKRKGKGGAIGAPTQGEEAHPGSVVPDPYAMQQQLQPGVGARAAAAAPVPPPPPAEPVVQEAPPQPQEEVPPSPLEQSTSALLQGGEVEEEWESIRTQQLEEARRLVDEMRTKPAYTPREQQQQQQMAAQQAQAQAPAQPQMDPMYQQQLTIYNQMIQQMITQAAAAGIPLDPSTLPPPPPPPVVQQQATPPPPPPAPPQPRGRNRDADALANTSDVYFAQLKRDSTVRSLARQAGDSDVAEAVFEDYGVKALADAFAKNPFLEELQQERLERQRQFLTTSDDEFLPGMLDDEIEMETELMRKTAERNAAPERLSYREKLRRSKARGKEGMLSSGADPVTTPDGEAFMEAQVLSQPEVAAEPVTTPPVVEVQAPPEPAVQVQAPPPPPEPVVQAQAPPPKVETTATPLAATTTTMSEDELRRQIRTLMGMMLKHRGGPGFGSGILKGPEAERFEATLQEIMTVLALEQESGAELTPAIMEAVVEQALDKVPEQPAPAAANDVVDAKLALLDVAVNQYRQSGDSSSLDGLRLACLDVVTGCNQVLAMAELESAEAVAATEEEASGAPEPQVQAPAASWSTTDANTEVLQRAYSALQDAAGDGKYGLRSDMTEPREVHALSDVLGEMRSVLMDELESGIAASSPQASFWSSDDSASTGSSTTTSSPAGTTGGSSSYAAKLAAAKAAKMAKED